MDSSACTRPCNRLSPLYDQGHLAIVHAAGSPDTTRSHFDAQDYMESGTPGVKATPDGWLNRALQAEDQHNAAHRRPSVQSPSARRCRRRSAAKYQPSLSIVCRTSA